MSNYLPHSGSNAIEGMFIVDRLFSCYKIMSHAAFRGLRDYDIKARTETLNAAIERFEGLREGVTSDVATILGITGEDRLVDDACRTLCERVSYPVVSEYLRISAQWKGNPSIEAFHERLTRSVRSITAQEIA